MPVIPVKSPVGAGAILGGPGVSSGIEGNRTIRGDMYTPDWAWVFGLGSSASGGSVSHFGLTGGLGCFKCRPGPPPIYTSSCGIRFPPSSRLLSPMVDYLVWGATRRRRLLAETPYRPRPHTMVAEWKEWGSNRIVVLRGCRIVAGPAGRAYSPASATVEYPVASGVVKDPSSSSSSSIA